MQRNMDLVRTILLRMEANPAWLTSTDWQSRGYTAQEAAYHAHIMKQDGLIEGVDTTSFESNGPEVTPTGLTWKGHEFLDLARDQERWKRAKMIIARVGSAPMEVWIKVLTDLVLKNLETTGTRSN
jgi:Hypothetical protein (DUF2513)